LVNPLSSFLYLPTKTQNIKIEKTPKNIKMYGNPSLKTKKPKKPKTHSR
jgi:hypothetical protein